MFLPRWLATHEMIYHYLSSQLIEGKSTSLFTAQRAKTFCVRVLGKNSQREQGRMANTYETLGASTYRS